MQSIVCVFIYGDYFSSFQLLYAPMKKLFQLYIFFIVILKVNPLDLIYVFISGMASIHFDKNFNILTVSAFNSISVFINEE